MVEHLLPKQGVASSILVSRLSALFGSPSVSCALCTEFISPNPQISALRAAKSRTKLCLF